MTRAGWTPVVIVAALLALLTYLFLQSRSPDLALRERIHETLQRFELHDAQLARDVLLARAGLLAHYDSLARTADDVTGDLRALRSQALTASDTAAQARLGDRVAALTDVTQRKLQVVEYFKSDNALLRNSLIYLTHAQAILRAKVDNEREVAREMGHLSHALLDFLQAPESRTGAEIRGVLDRLAGASAADAQFQTLVRHGRFVVDMLPQVDALLNQVIATPTAQHAQALQETVLRYAGQVDARAQAFRIALYLVAVTLLGYLAYQFLRLRAVATQLRASNADLGREMDERRAAETALRASEERLRAITESAKEAIVTADSRGNVVSWNAGAAAIFGYQVQEILGQPFTRLMPQRHHASHLRAFAEWIATGQSSLAEGTMEFIGLRRDAAEFPLEVSLSSWSTEAGRHVTGIMRDVSERKRLEETARQQELQLIQANKMTALGTLVSGVAHEINNPNQLVLLNSRVLAEAWDDAIGILDEYRERNGAFTLGGLAYEDMRQSVPTLVRDIHDGALRIERIVDDLKDFARPRPPGQTAIKLNEAIERALRLIAHVIAKRTAHFQARLAPDLPPLVGDAQQIEQIAINLIVNALEALPDRDRAVSVSTEYDAATRSLVLEVRDEGAGIAPEHLARLCDPFFTTKQASGGTRARAIFPALQGASAQSGLTIAT